MYQSSDNLEAFFKLCRRYGCVATDYIVHEGAIISSLITVARRDVKRPFMYGNRVKVNTVLVREGRMNEIESLLIGCVMEEMFE